VYLRGHPNILKRILIHTAAAMNLGLLMRTLFGVGTPRGLQGRLPVVFIVLFSFVRLFKTHQIRLWSSDRVTAAIFALPSLPKVLPVRFSLVSSFATGC
jgi:hypothetical protein